MGGFKFLEHPGDVYVEAFGSKKEEAFAEAGKALFAVIVRNVEDVGLVESREVIAKGYDVQSLLYDWLEKLLLLFEIDRFVGREVEVLEMKQEGEELILKAIIRGEVFDGSKHVPGVYVKAPTYWLMEIGERDGEHYLRYVLDI